MKKLTTTVLLLILTVGAACTPTIDAGKSTPPDSGVNAVVDEIEINLMESFPVRVSAVVRGHLPDGCTVLEDISVDRVDNVFTLDIAVRREGEVCSEALVPFEETVGLDVEGLIAGPYQVISGDVTAEFSLDIDNTAAHEPSVEYVRNLRGTVSEIGQGTDGVQVIIDSDGVIYSVTISVIQVEMFGTFDQIVEGAEVEVSGPIIAGMEPPIIVAERVTILGSEPDYVLNLRGTVIAIEPGAEGIAAEVESSDNTIYQVVISHATTDIVYIGEEEEIQVGTPVWISGELNDEDGPHITADTIVVNPITTNDMIEVQPIPPAGELDETVTKDEDISSE